MKSEHQIQSEILVALSRAGCTVCRSNAGKIRTKDDRTIMLFPKGWPDITGFRQSDGKMVLVEVKNEKGKLRPDQKTFANYIAKFPVLYGVARSADDALKIIQ
ncbi:VRR-NUC domain-containing protein [Paucilactobacillus sp. N302-9]